MFLLTDISTKGGALITIRDPPTVQGPFDLGSACERSVAVSGRSQRTLWEQQRPKDKPKRYKAVMKQIIGLPFSGVLDQTLEREIVQDLAVASRRKFDDPGLQLSEQRKILNHGLEPMLSKIRALIGSRVQIYLRSIASQLLDVRTNLTWSATRNNCQSFCNSLIKSDTFGPLVNGPDKPLVANADTLYLMSFVCPQEGYVKPKVRTKFDVPSGLTEEYLLKFRYGRHDEADLIDTLQEYWYDWGAFGSNLYPYQDLFPWDCTEAYGRYPTICGECNLAKHVWAFPFDSWSIISLHLTRDRYLYAPSNPDKPTILSNEDWMRTRLTLLLAQDALTTGAAAMARNPAFCNATKWLHEQKDPSLARLKLGGIHRAQPFSHYFEQGIYHHYFIAEWAHLTRKDQVAAYELMRDGRVRQPDVIRKGERFDADGDDGGYFDGFGGCGVTVDGLGVADSDCTTQECYADAGFGDMAIDGAGDGGAANCGSGCGTTDPDGGDGGDAGDSGGDGGGDGGCGGGCGGGGD